MSKFDLAFVDLDDTIYDTKKFKDDIFAVFKPYGLDYGTFIRAYRLAAELPEFGYFHYTFEKQIEAVRGLGYEVPDSIIGPLNELLKRNYIVSDAIGFLIYLKDICLKVILLTAGTFDSQAKKIEAIHVAPLVDEIKQIDGGKDDILGPLVAEGKSILFVNDNLDENIMIKNMLPAVAVLTKFNPSYWTEKECEKSGLPWFKNLSDIKNYVDKI